MTLFKQNKMEVSMSSVVGAIVVVTLVTWALKMVNWVWLRPKKLERCLREQGLRGSSYRLLYSDSEESSPTRKEANTGPLSLSDDFVPRILPLDHHNIEKYGKNSFLWIGRWPRVNIMDPEQIKDVCLKFGDFHKSISTNPLFKSITNGITSLEDDEWARHRNIINPAFHIKKLKLMLPAMYLSCAEMISKWENLVCEKGTCELDVWPFLQNLTRDVISRTAFGSSYEEGSVIFELQREQVKFMMKIIQAPYIPGLRYFPTKMMRRIKENNNIMHSVIKAIIIKREREMNAGEAKNDDLLGILLESNREEMRDHGNSKHVGLSLDDVIEECKVFYFGGQETTTVLLAWTMVLLSQHPTWQDRARAEVLQVFGDKKPDFEGLNHLKIVTMIFNEVLRLYPPIPTLYRTVHKETKLGNLTLPAGVQLALPVLIVQQDKEIWGDDAKEFKPERFAEGISKATKNKVSFLPFGWGPRICVGQNFAMIEAKLVLAMILQHFWFELSPGYKHSPINTLTLHPQHGCQIILHKH